MEVLPSSLTSSLWGPDCSSTARMQRAPPILINSDESRVRVARAQKSNGRLPIHATVGDRTRYILLLAPPNNFSTSATITSSPAKSIFPTRCQRITPCRSIT